MASRYIKTILVRIRPYVALTEVGYLETLICRLSYFTLIQSNICFHLFYPCCKYSKNLNNKGNNSSFSVQNITVGSGIGRQVCTSPTKPSMKRSTAKPQPAAANSKIARFPVGNSISPRVTAAESGFFCGFTPVPGYCFFPVFIPFSDFGREH